MALPLARDGLDLDHVGAEIAEPLRRERAGHGDGAVENAVAGEDAHMVEIPWSAEWLNA